MAINPLIRRYGFSAFRPQKIWVFSIMYLVLVAMVLFINYALWIKAAAYRSETDCAQGIFIQLVLFQVFLWWIVSAYQSSTAFREELLAKTYDFFRLLPLRPLAKMTGVTVGKNLLPIGFGLVNLVFVVIFALRGKLSVSLLLQTILLVVSVGVMFNLLGFLFSMKPNLQRGQAGTLFLVLVMIFIVPSMISGLFQGFRELSRGDYCIRFYSLRIPAMIFLSLTAWYLAIWAAVGILRRFRKEHEPLMTPGGAFLFFIGFELILTGLFVPHWQSEQEYLYAFWIISFIPLFFIPGGAIREFDQYLESLGGAGSKGKTAAPGLGFLFGRSVLAAGVPIWLVWAIVATGTLRFSQVNISNNHFALFVISSFYLFYLLLLELYVVYKTTSSKAGFLLAFLAFLYLALPPILAGVLQNRSLMNYSPLGFLFIVPMHDSRFMWKSEPGILIQNTILSLIALGLILRRYHMLLKLRRQMVGT